MSQYINDNIHINVWKQDDKHPRQYACSYSDLNEMMAKLERAKQRKDIDDYEIYSFSAYSNYEEDVKYGERIVIVPAIKQKKLLETA